MISRYIALVDISQQWEFADIREIGSSLHAQGMTGPITIGPFKLFTSEATPQLPLPGGGIAIGQLFKGLSRPSSMEAVVQASPGGRHVRDALTTSCWGEYVLVQRGEAHEAEAVVTRDPSGGLPCLYSLRNGIGFITSDLTLATSANLYQKRIDWLAISQCLAYPNLKTPNTAFSDVLELLPGSSLTIRPASVTTGANWTPWTFVADSHRHASLNEAAGDVRSAVEGVIKAWADLDDSILMELSGGLDSSIVATCLRNSGTPVTCYNLTTPVPGADERLYANAMANHLGLPLHVELLSTDINLDTLVPSAGSVAPRMGILQHVVSQAMTQAATRHSASSAYTGAGGDTVFGLLTNAVPAADAMRERGLAAGFRSIRDLSALHQCTMWKATRLTTRKLLGPGKSPFTADHTFLTTQLRTAPAPAHPCLDARKGALPGDRERIFDLASNQLFRDLVYRGQACAVRMPLLSQPVMEACLKVPTWMSIAAGQNRAVARAAFSSALPSVILNRRSKGSFVGYLGAIFQRNRVQMKHTLLGGMLRDAHLIDADALTRFFDAELPPRDTSFTRVLHLAVAENWLRHQS